MENKKEKKIDLTELIRILLNKQDDFLEQFEKYVKEGLYDASENSNDSELVKEISKILFKFNEKYIKKSQECIRKHSSIGDNEYLMYNIDSEYFNYLIKAKEIKKAKKFIESLEPHYKNVCVDVNNFKCDLNDRLANIEVLDIIREDLQEEIKREKYKIIEVVAIIIAIIGFLFSNINVLTKIEDFQSAKQYIMLIGLFMYGFPILWYLIQTEWKIKNCFKLISLTIVFITTLISILLILK